MFGALHSRRWFSGSFDGLPGIGRGMALFTAHLPLPSFAVLLACFMFQSPWRLTPSSQARSASAEQNQGFCSAALLPAKAHTLRKLRCSVTPEAPASGDAHEEPCTARELTDCGACALCQAGAPDQSQALLCNAPHPILVQGAAWPGTHNPTPTVFPSHVQSNRQRAQCFVICLMIFFHF